MHRIICPECKGTGEVQNLLDEYEVCTDCYEGTVRVAE